MTLASGPGRLRKARRSQPRGFPCSSLFFASMDKHRPIPIRVRHSVLTLGLPPQTVIVKEVGVRPLCLLEGTIIEHPLMNEASESAVLITVHPMHDPNGGLEVFDLLREVIIPKVHKVNDCGVVHVEVSRFVDG